MLIRKTTYKKVLTMFLNKYKFQQNFVTVQKKTDSYVFAKPNDFIKIKIYFLNIK